MIPAPSLSAAICRSVKVRQVTTLLLASQSPARAATLRSAGIDPIIRVSGLDEVAILTAASPATVPESVQVLAEAKARAVAADFPGLADVIVGCDSMLEFGGEGLGKPGSAEVAKERWLRMRGHTGTLHSGHFVIASDGRTAAGVSSTEVDFAHVSEEEIDAYIATGEPLQVAGAFTIDSLGGPFISAIRGDHHGVVGLSLPILRLLLAELGVEWISLWERRA